MGSTVVVKVGVTDWGVGAGKKEQAGKVSSSARSRITGRRREGVLRIGLKLPGLPTRATKDEVFNDEVAVPGLATRATKDGVFGDEVAVPGLAIQATKDGVFGDEVAVTGLATQATKDGVFGDEVAVTGLAPQATREGLFSEEAAVQAGRAGLGILTEIISNAGAGLSRPGRQGRSLQPRRDRKM